MRTEQLLRRKARLTRALDRRDRLAWRVFGARAHGTPRWTPRQRVRRMRLYRVDLLLEREGYWS